ncbi:MAG: bifunctional phosphoribosyl-AMP cyclohydrolase/phosphoribosyl-ATP diphosphatase HisIE [Firmicutes bacterium]|nr:bifunctional phosphoribosyl-AMP cyclohydrolase/phosphoribosyl-ATP diphosphatase HisIE [Bacillota bacterium]
MSLRFDAHGLLPVVVLDAEQGELLMLAYANRQALSKTLESGESWFYSRSRQVLWHKGATSGHTQEVVRIAYDCDADTLCYFVRPAGPACHTGEQSCFYRTLADRQATAIRSAATVARGEEPDAHRQPSEPVAFPSKERAPATDVEVLNDLMLRIAQRQQTGGTHSYTAQLLGRGVEHVAKKFGEEAVELALASVARQPDEVVYEAADTLYHLLALLTADGVPLESVLSELRRRYERGS